MKVIQFQTSYSSQIIKKLKLKAIVLVLGLILSFLFFSAVGFVQKDLNPTLRGLLIVLGYVTLGIFYWFTRHKYIDEFFNNLMGKTGEDEVSEILKNNFDDSYTYIRNYEMSEFRIGDIDGILISHNEIIILEVKFYQGNFEINNGEFYKLSKKGYLYRLWHNPIYQAQRQKDCLLQYLDAKGINVPIRALVVLASGNIQSIKGATHVYVLNEDNLVDFLKKEILSFDDGTPPVSVDSLTDSLIGNNIKEESL